MGLFNADKVVTVVNRTTDGKTDATTYTCHSFAGCSWYSTHGKRRERSGVKPDATVKIRIPADAAPGFGTDWTLDAQTVLFLGAVYVEDDAEFSAACKAHESARVLAWHDHPETVFSHIYVEGG